MAPPPTAPRNRDRSNIGPGLTRIPDGHRTASVLLSPGRTFPPPGLAEVTPPPRSVVPFAWPPPPGSRGLSVQPVVSSGRAAIARAIATRRHLRIDIGQGPLRFGGRRVPGRAGATCRNGRIDEQNAPVEGRPRPARGGTIRSHNPSATSDGRHPHHGRPRDPSAAPAVSASRPAWRDGHRIPSPGIDRPFPHRRRPSGPPTWSAPGSDPPESVPPRHNHP